MLLEVDGKLVVGKSEPNPLRCPQCRRFSPWKETAAEGNLRCNFCSHQGTIEEFKEVNFVEIAPVRLLAYY